MNKPKVFLAVPNTGTIRDELFDAIRGMFESNIADIYMPTLHSMNNRPGSHNRNLINNMFLETDCEWFLTIDSDIVPRFNPLHVIKADQDVVGFPALIHKHGQLMWVVFNDNPYSSQHHSTKGFIPVNVDAVLEAEKTKGLLEVDYLGSGMMLIKRKVLESIKAPFERMWREDGTVSWGHDFYFCKKAKEAGFKLFCAIRYLCEHWKTVPLLSLRDEIRDHWVNEYYERTFFGYNSPQKKVYVVGTGRCGTMSVSKQLGGVHEPYPWVVRESFYQGIGVNGNIGILALADPKIKVYKEELKKKLLLRSLMTVPCIADNRQSWIIPDICNVDSNAEFLVLIREPLGFVSSATRRGWYELGDMWDSYRMRPSSGWIDGWTTPMKLGWLWRETNRRIFEDLEKTGAPFEVKFTHNLGGEVLNASPENSGQSIDLSDEEKDFFDRMVYPRWNEYVEKWGPKEVSNES